MFQFGIIGDHFLLGFLGQSVLVKDCILFLCSF